MTLTIPRDRWQVNTIRCELCGREAGQVVQQVYFQFPRAPVPCLKQGISSCGQCGGHLSAFADELAVSTAARLPREEPWHRGNDGGRLVRRGRSGLRR